MKKYSHSQLFSYTFSILFIMAMFFIGNLKLKSML